MTFRAAVLVALAAVLAACGQTAAEEAGKPRPVSVCKQARVRVTVMDGDLHKPVIGATTRIGDRVVVTDERGRAWHDLRCRRSVPVRIRADGYLPKLARPPFRVRKKVVVRIYKRSLQWTLYGASPGRTQAHKAISVRPPFKIRWARGFGTLIEFPAVVSEGVGYVGNLKGTIYAFSMRDGRIAWKRKLREKMASSPAIVRDLLVVHTMRGRVWVLKRSNGKPLWSFSTGSRIESSPIVRYGIDYFGTHSGRVYAVDVFKRKVRWVRGGNCKITGSVALQGGTLYVGDYCGRVLALDHRTGRTRWTAGVGGRVYGTIAVLGRRLFVPSSTGGSLTALSTRGRYLWRIGTGSYVYSSPATWAGRVFFGSYNGRLYAANAANGRILWSRRVGGRISGAVVVVAGVAYAGTKRRILGVDAKSGRVLVRFPHGDYVPVSGNGRRLLLHGFSKIWAVDPKRRR